MGAGMLAAVVGVVATGGFQSRSRTGGERRRSFPAFSRAIVGTTKGMIVDVLGPPPTATRSQGGDYLTSETWYYPLDVRERSGMAIRFGGREDRAVAVEKIWAPR